MTKLNTLLKLAEESREKGEYAKALAYADNAIIESTLSLDIEGVVEALAAKLIIYKHLFQKTENKAFNELMYGDVQTGLSLVKLYKLSGHPKAVMEMRAGDYFLQKKSYRKAIGFYAKAVKSAGKTVKPSEFAEFLGHLGMAEILYGRTKSGRDRVIKALAYVKKDKTLRTFHRLTITSGMLFRIAASYAEEKNAKKFDQYYKAAMIEAEVLESKYNMPMRKLQGEKLLGRYSLS